jgi:hypothetical protein
VFVLKKMGLTKQYLRYAPQAVFNIVGSGRGGAVYLDAKGGLELISFMFILSIAAKICGMCHAGVNLTEQIRKSIDETRFKYPCQHWLAQLKAVLRIRDVYPGSDFFPSRIRIKEFSILTLKKLFLSSRNMIRVVHPGSGC